MPSLSEYIKGLRKMRNDIENGLYSKKLKKTGIEQQDIVDDIDRMISFLTERKPEENPAMGDKEFVSVLYRAKRGIRQFRETIRIGGSSPETISSYIYSIIKIMEVHMKNKDSNIKTPEKPEKISGPGALDSKEDIMEKIADQCRKYAASLMGSLADVSRCENAAMDFENGARWAVDHFDLHPKAETTKKNSECHVLPRDVFNDMVRSGRRRDLMNGITAYAEKGLPIPIEWIQEYNELCSHGDASRNTSSFK